MKNIITIVLILIIPVFTYIIMSNNSNNQIATAKDNSPSLYVYTSNMCMDCQRIKNTINEIEPIYSEKINFIIVNATDKKRKIQEQIKKHNITLVPTLIILDRNGNRINKIEGYIEKDKLIQELEDAING